MRSGLKRLTWRQISEPIEPPAPVTKIVLPVSSAPRRDSSRRIS